jgi:hypothetical protein
MRQPVIGCVTEDERHRDRPQAGQQRGHLSAERDTETAQQTGPSAKQVGARGHQRRTVVGSVLTERQRAQRIGRIGRDGPDDGRKPAGADVQIQARQPQAVRLGATAKSAMRPGTSARAPSANSVLSVER